MKPGIPHFRWSVLVAASMCTATIRVKAAITVPAAPGPDSVDTGLASYYADAFDGRPTASGEIFNMQELTAAHRTLPFGTRLRVTNMENGRTAVVRVNDRGPFVEGRVLDLSLGAARALRMTGTGVGPVRLEVLPRMARISLKRPAPAPYQRYALELGPRPYRGRGDREVPRFFAARADELHRAGVDFSAIALGGAQS